MFTVGWLLLSVTLGGFAGAFLKFLFEVALPQTIAELNRKRRLKKQIIPIFDAEVTDLEQRLARIVFGKSSEMWLDEAVFNELEANKGFLESYHDGVGYFGLSTSYVVIRLFAAMEMIRRLSTRPDMFELGKSVRNYKLIVSGTDCLRVDEPITGVKIQKDKFDFSSLTRHIQASIGNFLLSDQGEVPRILSFKDFVLMYKNDNDFRKWVKCVEGYFRGLKTETSLSAQGFHDQRAVRLGAFAYYL